MEVLLHRMFSGRQETQTEAREPALPENELEESCTSSDARNDFGKKKKHSKKEKRKMGPTYKKMSLVDEDVLDLPGSMV